jgi:hypothetical protein
MPAYFSPGPVSRLEEIYHPNCSCVYKTCGRWCKNVDCPAHGHFERNRRSAKWQRFNPSLWDVYSLTLAYGGKVLQSQYLSVRNHFRDVLALVLKPYGYGAFCYRTEFVNLRPHIHWLFRLPKGSDFTFIASIVRGCWKEALDTFGIWRGQRVGVDPKLAKDHYDLYKMSDYIFSTNFSSWRLNNCRPVEWKCHLSYTHPSWAEKSFTLSSQQWDAVVALALADGRMDGKKKPCPWPALVQPETFEFAPVVRKRKVIRLTVRQDSCCSASIRNLTFTLDSRENCKRRRPFRSREERKVRFLMHHLCRNEAVQSEKYTPYRPRPPPHSFRR